MSNLTEENILALAKLCRLEISEEEVSRLQHDLQRVLSYVEQLQTIDVGDLNAYSHMEEQSLSTQRKDEITETLPRERFLANAPEHIGGMVRVPTVIRHVSKDS